MSSAALSLYASSKNKSPILTTITPFLDKLRNRRIEEENRNTLRLMEIASGTGEHAAFFKSNVPYLIYQPTEPDSAMHESIAAWCKDFSGVYPPVALDVNNYDYNDTIFPEEYCNQNTDVMICINMIHISPQQSTLSLFKIASQMIKSNGMLITYGPYKVKGFMVPSNIEFDESLKVRNIEYGIRELDDVVIIANENNFDLEEKIEMPSNNLTLIFRKK